MNAVRGRVRHGHVETDSPLPDGAEVVILLPEQGDIIELDDASTAELEARALEADAGDVEPAAEVLRRLRPGR